MGNKIDFEGTVLSETSEREKDKYKMISFTCDKEINKTNS